MHIEAGEIQAIERYGACHRNSFVCGCRVPLASTLKQMCEIAVAVHGGDADSISYNEDMVERLQTACQLVDDFNKVSTQLVASRDSALVADVIQVGAMAQKGVHRANVYIEGYFSELGGQKNAQLCQSITLLAMVAADLASMTQILDRLLETQGSVA